MCGIAGLLPAPGGRLDQSVLNSMCRALAHRGPDDWGIALGSPGAGQSGNTAPDHSSWFASATRIGLAHTRLSIIDLSAAGHQPMSSEDAQTWIVYNGELYNFAELRQELEHAGHRFRSRTDTEVILRLFEVQGTDCFRRLNGMFAVAIWDNRTQALYLARDRFGVKPLYYAAAAEGFVFGSELKALWRAGLSGRLDLHALNRYLAFLYVPEPDTILEGVRKVPAGHWMRITAGTGVTEARPFWTLDCGRESPAISERRAVEELRTRLATAVVRQTVGDVPVSAFLSGGLDSSGVVALMTRAGRPPRSVHAIGFSARDRRYERGIDDLPYARRLASRLGLDYDELILSPDVVNLLPKLVWHLDEPLADPAVIPAFLIAQRAARRTKVLLSGMGSDELFGGYRRHLSHELLSRFSHVPPVLRRRIHSLVNALPSGGAAPFVSSIRHARKLLGIAAARPEIRPVSSCMWMDAPTRLSLYSTDVRHLVQYSAVDGRHVEVLKEAGAADFLTQMLCLDTRLYLPGHNLNYTDKMSMAASVEVRVPFLDNDVVDFAFSLPSSLKIRGLQTKYVLKRALDGILPSGIINRRKSGFSAPIRSWLTNDLREMAADLLSHDRIARRGLFEPRAVASMLQHHHQGHDDRSYNIWALLHLELWMQIVLDDQGRAAA
jgi:asparagine synthase (glutamine-hydrolysing)